MQSCIFPHELVDYIIDFLYNDLTTLQNCSLVCRAWVPTSRIHIFRRIYFPPTNDAAYRRFHWLLEHTPSVIPLIQDLQMLNGGFGWEHFSGWATDSDPWASAEESPHRVLTILQSARNLKTFSILLKDKWIELPLNLRTSVRTLLQLPSLTEVDLIDCKFESVSDLNALFCHCSGLKRVNLSQITFRYHESLDEIGENFPHVQHSDRPHLECLALLNSDVSHITDWVLHPRAAVDVTTLRKLRSSIAPRPMEISLLEKFLGIISSSLEHLHLELDHGFTHLLSPYIDMNQQHLRSLRLSFHVTSCFKPLTWVTNLFSQITSNSIHEIVIDLRLNFNSDHFPSEVLSFPWDDLDVALNPTVFSLLQQVDVTISRETNYSKTTWALDDVEELLPRLASRGILRVYELVYEDSWFYKWPGPTWQASS